MTFEHERLPGLPADAPGSVRPGRVHWRQYRLCRHACHADRPGRAVDRCRDAVRQHQSRGDRADASIAQGALWTRGWSRRSVSHLLAPRRGRRFRALALGVPDAGRGAHRTSAALDRGAAGGLDLAHLGAGQPFGRPRRLLPEEPRAAPRRRPGDGVPSHPLLHRGLPAAHRVRLSVAGAAARRRLQDEHAARLELGLFRQPRQPFHPADPLPGAGRAGRLVHGHAFAGVQHRDRGLRRLRRAGWRRAPPHPGLLRHAQRAGAAGHRPRHVARRHLQRRHHHRAGVRLSRRRHAPGVGGLCRRLQPGAGHHHRVDRGRLARGAADRPFISAARSPGQGALTMGRTVLHLLRFNRQFAAGVVLLAVVAGFSGLSFFSPYPPNDSFVVPPDLPPSWVYPMATTSRGQDLFWLLSFAIRNTLLFGMVVAVLSRILALAIGLVAGYSGGLLDRALLSLNDTFIVIPLFPILVLFYFVMREHMSWGLLALMMACLGGAYDARLIRSVAMSLRTREFTETGIFSGMSTRQILVEEHFPYVLPTGFSTTFDNIP